jgi:glycine/D-amino acid oxidase-like deaminating enzyme
MTRGSRTRQVDVAVIGGGIVGAATAAFLAGAGARVRLYERTEIAAAASGRNSGVVQHPFDPLLAGLYRESLGHYRALADDDPDAFRLGAEPAGLLAVDGGGGKAAHGTAGAWRAAYPDSRPEIVEGADLRRLEPELAAGIVACRLAIGYPVGPATATLAFAALAVRRGAEVRLGSEVGLAVREANVVGVAADGGLEPADAVVVAAGPWTPQIVDPSGGWRPIRPVWGVVAAVGLDRPPGHVLEEAEIDIEPADEAAATLSAAEGAFGFSLVTADGSSALGSTFLDDEPVAEWLVDELRVRGSRFVPSIAAARVVGVRSCARPLALDRRPLVGRLAGRDGAFVVAGHGPWGISTGPATARMVADLVLGRDARIPVGLDPARFGEVGG